jgi:sulfite reductase beta subunit-like hemoprotein
MAQTKTGNRADRESLRVVMIAQGCGIDEIAAELRVRLGVALRAAYRHANRLNTAGWGVWLMRSVSAAGGAYLGVGARLRGMPRS